MAYMETGLLAAILILIVAFTLSVLDDTVAKIAVVTLCLAILFVTVRQFAVMDKFKVVS